MLIIGNREPLKVWSAFRGFVLFKMEHIMCLMPLYHMQNLFAIYKRYIIIQNHGHFLRFLIPDKMVYDFQ